MDEAGTCYGGGDIAGAIIGSLIGGAVLTIIIWWLYNKYWRHRNDIHLMTKDPENVDAEFAFDNPAFKGDQNKANSPLDTKWTSKSGSNDKRKTVDDSYAGSPKPRLVSLRGSDFTGLGIEVSGGLKEGIFIKKVMPQGPAAHLVNIGDKITSITIDFRHIVQEDAMTILSYASPYNVELELVEGKGILPTFNTTSSPKIGSQQSLTHPLYRSSSQEDFNTIERNARKKLFPNDDGNYPTLKMEQQRQSPQHIAGNLPIAYKENEKKNSLKQQFKELIEEKLQTKSVPIPNKLKFDERQSSVSPTEEGKKGLKFGIRVLPPTIDDKLKFDKSPTKIQADNENNTNEEKIIELKLDESGPNPSESTEFYRQGSINSSGIKRDAAGIPQEVPNHMMQAAMAARDNRKSSSSQPQSNDVRKSKGKAPRPPPKHDTEMLDLSTETIATNLSVDITDSVEVEQQPHSPISKLNFSDNFTDDVLGKTDIHMTLNQIDEDLAHGRGPSNSSTPKSDRKRIIGSDTESQMAEAPVHEHESDIEITYDGKNIELNSKQITVHQSSEDGSGDDESRRTASLGDLSKFELTLAKSSREGSLERAQSLEMTDSPTVNKQSNGVTPKKRKASSNQDLDDSPETIKIKEHYKEPRLSMDLSTLDTMQRGRLKSAYEWGNLEDAIEVKENQKVNRDSDTESIDREQPIGDVSNDMIKDVMAVADRFEFDEYNREIKESANQIVTDVQNQLNSWDEERERIEMESRRKISNLTAEFINNEIKNSFNSVYNSPRIINKNIYKAIPITSDYEKTTPSSNFQFSAPELPADDPIQFIRHIEARDYQPIDSEIDQIKIINYGTNMPDDAKVSRYPFGSLERPKSDVLKKLMEKISSNADELNQQKLTSTTLLNESPPASPIPSKGLTAITVGPATYYTSTDSEPVSLTLTSPPTESDLTESSQISPVYSSDGQGVNSISISSMEVNITPDLRKDQQSTGIVGIENIVTITSSQPSSIIMIEDQNLDFTLMTPPPLDDLELEELQLEDEIEQPPPVKKREEVVVIESLSSKKIPEPIETIPNDRIKSFVTEIQVKTPMNGVVREESLDSSKQPNISPKRIVPPKPKFSTQSKSMVNLVDPERTKIIEQEYIPRNSEIKFTTSTYQSPQHKLDKHNSVNHIDQIRSNFEKYHMTGGSEIPIPVRKTSNGSSTAATTTRTSPSKIPVFNSKSSGGSSNSLNYNNGHESLTSIRNGGSAATSPNGNRVSVTVTSIKNSSRHPSAHT